VKLYWKVKRNGKWSWEPAEIGYMTFSDWITVLSPSGAGITCDCVRCIQPEESE
jgi:hypothetical protein